MCDMGSDPCTADREVSAHQCEKMGVTQEQLGRQVSVSLQRARCFRATDPQPREAHRGLTSLGPCQTFSDLQGNPPYRTGKGAPVTHIPRLRKGILAVPSGPEKEDRRGRHRCGPPVFPDTSWALSPGTRELVGVCCLRLLPLPRDGVPHRLPPRVAQEEPPHCHSRPQGPSYH